MTMRKPNWIYDMLKGLGYKADKSMDEQQRLWDSWFKCDNQFYTQTIDLNLSHDLSKRLSIRPARMVADEMASLLMNENTIISSEDDDFATWIEERVPDFADENSDFISEVFALGSGAWALTFSFEDTASVEIVRYSAQDVYPILGGGCAFASRVEINAVQYDQIQIHRTTETGSQEIKTHLFDVETHKPVVVEGVIDAITLPLTIPTYTIVSPAKANTYSRYSKLGTSIYDDAIDSFRFVDEAFNELFWHTRLSRPRMIMDESAIKIDKYTGEPDLRGSVDQVLYTFTQAAVGQTSPVTIYNPETRIADTMQALNSALSIMSVKCGFGQGYFAFDFKQGLKTATAVIADNSQLYRNIHRHEKRLGLAISSIIKAAYASEVYLNHNQIVDDTVEVTINWDDSVMIDTEQERQVMKDDIARGLCPAWYYPSKYYGLSEEEARAVVGDTAQVPELGEI